jgi:hypothetical protein
MSRQIQLRRGSTVQHSTFTGAAGEVTVDTDKDAVVIHDGSTAGGFPTISDKTVVLTEGSNVTITGTYPNFTIASTDNNTTYSAGTGLDLTGTTFSTDSTILKDTDIGVTVQAYDATYVVDADIGVTVQAYNATYVVDADIGVTVQGYDVDTAKLDVAQTFTANQTVTGELVATSYNETYAAVTSTTNATTINCEAGNTFSHTLTEDTTFTFSNPPTSGTGYSFTLKIVQDSTARAITWPASVDWAAATAPTISTGSGEVDVFVFFTTDGGTTFYGFTAGQVLS